MKVIIPTHKGDIDQAIDLAKLIGELGTSKRHGYKVFVGQGTPQSKVRALEEALEAISDDVKFHELHVNENVRDLEPTPADHVPRFNSVTKEILKTLSEEKNDLPFLLLEPDSTPMRGDWLEEIEVSYQKARSSGKLILAGETTRLEVELTMNYQTRVKGIQRVTETEEFYSPASPAVYPAELIKVATLIPSCNFEPWDVKCRHQISKVAQTTREILHAHDSKEFEAVDGGYEYTPHPKLGDRRIVECGSALIHGCKDDSLRKIVRSGLQKGVESGKNDKETEKTTKKLDPREAALAKR